MDPNDNSILYIYLVNPSQAAAEAAAVRYFGHDKLRSIREIRPLQAQFTLKQLREWYDKDLIEARPLSLPEVTLTDLDEVSRAARRCTTAAEESCTTGTMRKD